MIMINLSKSSRRCSSLTSLTGRCKSSYIAGGSRRRSKSLPSLTRCKSRKTKMLGYGLEEPENFLELFPQSEKFCESSVESMDSMLPEECGLVDLSTQSLSSVHDHEELCVHVYCNFAINHLQNPDAVIHLFVVYFCERRGYDAVYDLCSAFNIPAAVCVKIQDTNSSLKLQCFDVLHRVYHRHNEQLSLAMIKTTLSEYSDELRQIISDYKSLRIT